MRALEAMKVEGSIPYDERHELMGALKHCPLQKVVIIGVCYPGSSVTDFEEIDVREAVQSGRWDLRNPLPISRYGQDRYWGSFASENEWAEACRSAAATTFTPSHGPRAGFAPIIDTIALYHASTITELKFCGFRGAPILHSPTLKTPFILRSLQRFHQLRYIATAVWMLTFYDGSNRGEEISAYWLAPQSPESTALALTNATNDNNEWPRILAQRFAPIVLAQKVADLMGPYLSRQSKARPPGVTVRALFLLTKDDNRAELCELEVVVGPRWQVVSFRGPRGEHDAEKFHEKLENR
ncbi:hypothetical protein MMC08_009122, partial [Hypocenomyce scalaris]|nr:hypothetical protein [Hypocenomyce scalaris]